MTSVIMVHMANLEATGVTGSGNLKCCPTPPLLELETPGRAVQGGVFDVTITCKISCMMATSVVECGAENTDLW